MGYSRKTHAVFGMLSDKDIAGWSERSNPTSTIGSSLHCRVRAGATAARLRADLVHAGVPASSIRVFGDIEGAFDAAREQAAENDRIVVFGSFLTVAAAIDATTAHPANAIASQGLGACDRRHRRRCRRAETQSTPGVWSGPWCWRLARRSSFRCCSKKTRNRWARPYRIQIPPIDDSKFVSRLSVDNTSATKTMPNPHRSESLHRKAMSPGDSTSSGQAEAKTPG
jgi:hypothetical protein